MHSVTTPIFAEYVQLWTMIDAVQFNPSDLRSDEIVWTCRVDGMYSARSAYAMQFDGSLGSSFPNSSFGCCSKTVFGRPTG
jgi:hypothetical protein